MANYGQPDLKIGISTASGSTTLRDLSIYIDTINGVKRSAITVQSDGFSRSWQEFLYVGIKKMEKLTVEGWYNDLATSGPHVILGQTTDLGAERNFEIDNGASDVVNGDVLIEEYETIAKRGDLTRFRSVWQPTGTISTAT